MKSKKLISLATLMTFSFLLLAQEEIKKPNIVLIMVDDMGFSDLGCYGGEIKTPNIDKLARNGVRFSQFKNAGRCCPSRAALMTGRTQHAVGMGWMTAVDEHRPGYRGQLSNKVPTIAEILKENGYGTYLSGKWHLTLDGNFNDPKSLPNGSWPVQRGFDESYGGLDGGVKKYNDVPSLVRNTHRIDSLPADYYYTTAITNNAVSFIEKHDSKKPMFLYVAHFAPHRPLQAPKERVETCLDRYKVGYDVLRKARYKRMKEEGIITDSLELPVHQKEYNFERPDWKTLEDKKKAEWVKEMATYAAMVEIVDDGIGLIIDALKKKGIYDNTTILFLSDNGATMEGGEISKLAADLSNTPYRSYKSYVFNGGISSPFIIHNPKKYSNQKGMIKRELIHITDILPTCLSLANIEYPLTFNGSSIAPPDGISITPAMENIPLKERDLFFEHEVKSAIISNNWKLVRNTSPNSWELINLLQDPFELKDLSLLYPDKVEKLKKKWMFWANKNNVLPVQPHFGWDKRINFFKKRNPDQDGID
ncbi:arylsulfatase [Sabulilitoribacter arenilitoris]|uniref:Arylsulfatase n=1 Tax=Wocania arenilitoris TaxID=2044858 RepID=A0AAE3ELB2_9FLAO|nr:arylsulfatase [Wocania arenilitoris]MCF7567048.1 arylsulfatase [Wocania arenilitoris]